MPDGKGEIKPTKRGVALRLKEWSNIRYIIKKINDDFPELGTALPC